MARFEGTIPAPELPEPLVCFNVAAPLRLADYKGRLVLLYFWNGANLTAIRGLRRLAMLQRSYSAAVAVVTVHSARYKAERSENHVADCVARYSDGALPVVHDPERRVWDSYRIQASPTLVLIDYKGNLVMRHRGEFDYDGLQKIVAEMLDVYKLPTEPTEGISATETAQTELETGYKLRYPTKIELQGDKLYIADSGNRRVVVANKAGKFENAITQVEGVALVEPCGIVCAADVCYVADGGVGGIFAFAKGRYEQARWLVKPQTALLEGVGDLAVHKGELFAALAERNQIWRVDLQSGQLEAWVGTGKFGNWDDVRAEAFLAQPLALASNGGLLFADSENNTIRVVNPVAQGRVVTLAGGGLHDWGDYDALAKEARLQHPRGVVCASDVLYIADTYNHKIKQMNIRTLKLTTIAGTGEAGSQDGNANTAQFNNPEGLKIANDTLYIADTNNHKIRTLNLKTNEVSNLILN